MQKGSEINFGMKDQSCLDYVQEVLVQAKCMCGPCILQAGHCFVFCWIVVGWWLYSVCQYVSTNVIKASVIMLWLV